MKAFNLTPTGRAAAPRSPSERRSFKGDCRRAAFSTASRTANLSGNIRKGGVLFEHNRGTDNVAVGIAAASATTGASNVAVGKDALLANVGGSENTAIGTSALILNTGSDNTAIGKQALNNLSSGSNNIGIGVQAGGTLNNGSNNIFIGNAGADVSGMMALGGGNTTTTIIAGIRGTTVGGAQTVFIAGNGQLGTISSSRRYKQDIQDIGERSHDLMKLRPVSFHYKEFPTDSLEYGLIAEEVADVFPEMVLRDKDGQIQSVQYHKVNALLLSEVQAQAATIQEQREAIRALTNRLTAVEGLLGSRLQQTSTAGQ